MNLKQALYLKTIAECGSVTAAAKQLGVSQPSLSQMLRHVEDGAGLPLFDRSTSSFRLTYAGERYLQAARTILAANEELENQLREIRCEDSGRLRLGISPARGLQVLPLVIPAFSKEYPNVVVELTECGSELLDSMMQQGKLDLALAAVESTGADMTYELLGRETIGILAGRDSKLARKLPSGTPVTVVDARDDQFVRLRKGHSSRVVQELLFRQAGIEPKILLETDSLEMGKQVTLEAGACMILPNIYVDEYVALRQGEFFPLAGYEHHRHFYAVYRKDAFVPKYMRDFIRIVIETLQSRPKVELKDA